MAQNWKHSKFGELQARKSGSGWFTEVRVPEFAAFSYDTGYENARQSKGDISFGLTYWLAKEKADAPTPGMAAVAEKIVADPARLVEKVVAALWDDFNGRGPDSGMWWHGGMDQIEDTFKSQGLPPPQRAQDLLKVLQLTDITVLDKTHEYPHPCAVLGFHAAFEEEHGVSLLSDGDEIIGAGYSGEAEPWQEE